MSAAKRKRTSLSLDLPPPRLNSGHGSAPAIAALFLVTFDVKAGYSIAWQRSIDGLRLSQSVEYKSLPSGLHNVPEDLVYFTHDDEYAGASAYINRASPEAERNSVMIAVGILLPSHGQLGRAWLHVEALKQLAKSMAENTADNDPLEDYWDAHQIRVDEDDQTGSPDMPSPSLARAKRKQGQSNQDEPSRIRNRAVSTASALAPHGEALPGHHPAQSLPDFIDTFGPLIFPLYKFAMLRKKILFVSQAPIESACNFVYDSSLVSGIPASVSQLIPLEPLPFRLPPLFSVGLHDLDDLMPGSHPSGQAHDDGFGWVACTTDEILGQKPGLRDYLVQLPPPHAKQAARKVWPHILDSKGREVKATQRDLRRYRILKREIDRFGSVGSPGAESPILSRSVSSLHQIPYETDTSSIQDADLAEKKSVMAVMYEGFMWWAAAGEKRSDLDEEEQQDAGLLQPLSGGGGTPRTRSSGRSPSGMHTVDFRPGSLEVAITAFFHRLTTQILKTLAEIVSDYADGDSDAAVAEDGDGENGNGEEALASTSEETSLIGAEENAKKETVLVEADDMSRMGLDLWSESDRQFVEGLVSLYWGRRARVAKTPAIECCGVRVC